MRLGVGLVLFALLAPSVLAGTEDAPEIRDTRDQDDPAHDLLAVWLADDPRGLRVTWKIVGLVRPPTLHLYTAAFRLDGARHTVGVGFDENAALVDGVDATPSAWFQSADGALVDVALTRGTPAYLSAVVPRERLGLAQGHLLTAIEVYVAYYDDGSGTWASGVDAASSRATYRFGGERPWPVWLVPVVLLAATAGGAAGGWWFWRGRR